MDEMHDALYWEALITTLAPMVLQAGLIDKLPATEDVRISCIAAAILLAEQDLANQGKNFGFLEHLSVEEFNVELLNILPVAAQSVRKNSKGHH